MLFRSNHIAAVLKNHGHFAAIHLPPLLRRVLQYILTIKGNGACAHAASTGHVDVEPGDTPETLQQRVMRQAEWVILPRAAELCCAKIKKEWEA